MKIKENVDITISFLSRASSEHVRFRYLFTKTAWSSNKTAHQWPNIDLVKVGGKIAISISLKWKSKFKEKKTALPCCASLVCSPRFSKNCFYFFTWKEGNERPKINRFKCEKSGQQEIPEDMIIDHLSKMLLKYTSQSTYL